MDFDREDGVLVAIVLDNVLVDTEKTDIILESPQHCDGLPQHGIQGLGQVVGTPAGLSSFAQKPDPISAARELLKCA